LHRVRIAAVGRRGYANSARGKPASADGRPWCVSRCVLALVDAAEPNDRGFTDTVACDDDQVAARQRPRRARAKAKTALVFDSRRIDEAFPDVEEIRASATFSDDSGAVREQHSFHWGAENVVENLRIRCRLQRECVDGGLDLYEPVLTMVKRGEHERTFRENCQGWQDRERIGQHRCLCGFDVVLSLTRSGDQTN
jgi:hypothetical protein